MAKENLEEPSRRRIGWDPFLEFVAGLDEACPDAVRLDAIVQDAVLASEKLAVMVGLYDEPIDFYRLVNTHYLPALLRPLRVAFESQSSGKAASEDVFRVIVEVAAPHRASASLLRLIGAFLRAQPGALGLDPASVASDVRDRGAAYLVKVAMTKTARARLKRSAREIGGEATRALLEESLACAVESGEALETSRVGARDDEERRARMHALGTELGRCSEVDELGTVLAEVLQKPPFLCESVALSLADHGAAHAILRAGEMTPGAVVRTEPLRVGEREVARLETSGYLSSKRPDMLDDLAIWLGIAIDRLLLHAALKQQRLSNRPPEEGPSDEVLRRRLGRAAEEWQLTPRQLACVERLVRGRSNREIARDIGCTERTVEAHLAVVFRRAVVRARSSLVARFWSEAW